VATGINAALAKNGENAATADLDAGGFKVTNAADGVAVDDLATVGQLQDGGLIYATSAGTDTITLTLSPAVTAYVDGQSFTFKAGGSNTGAATLDVNGVGAKAVTDRYINALTGGAITSGGIYTVIYDGTQFQLQTAATGDLDLNGNLITSLGDGVADDDAATFLQVKTVNAGVHVDLGTGEPATSTTLLQFTQATLTINVFEGVGPTASGEPNIWTALDGVPSGVDWIECYMQFRAGDNTSNSAGASVHAKANGSAASMIFTTEIIRATVTGDSTGDQSVVSTSNSVKIPVVSRVFDIGYTDQMAIGTPDTIALDIRLTGYGYN